MQKWYLYDTEKNNLFKKVVYADNQPECSTSIPPYETSVNGIAYPISNSHFNVGEQKWEGNNAQLSQLTSLALLTKQVMSLQLVNQQQKNSGWLNEKDDGNTIEGR